MVTFWNITKCHTLLNLWYKTTFTFYVWISLGTPHTHTHTHKHDTHNLLMLLLLLLLPKIEWALQSFYMAHLWVKWYLRNFTCSSSSSSSSCASSCWQIDESATQAQLTLQYSAAHRHSLDESAAQAQFISQYSARHTATAVSNTCSISTIQWSQRTKHVLGLTQMLRRETSQGFLS